MLPVEKKNKINGPVRSIRDRKSDSIFYPPTSSSLSATCTYFAYPSAQGRAKAMATIHGKNVMYLELSGLLLAQQTTRG